MSDSGLGCAKTKTDLVVVPSGRQIFPFFCPPHRHRAQNSGCDNTAQSFYTARVIRYACGPMGMFRVCQQRTSQDRQKQWMSDSPGGQLRELALNPAAPN